MRRTMAACVVAIAAFATSASADSEAYQATITTGTTGNGKGRQTLNNSTLGLDFEVTYAHITISALGIWDDVQGNGLQSAHDLMIYDLNNPAVPLAWIKTLPGTGTLIDGYRYFDLPTPLLLDMGTQFTIAVYYPTGNLDSNGNSGPTPPSLGEPAPIFMGGGYGYIQNIGGARYLKPGFGFPGTLDTGPANRYHSGSFLYSPNPEPGTILLVSGALAGVAAWRRRRAKLQRA